MMRASSGIASPARPSGYPPPSQRSWCERTIRPTVAHEPTDAVEQRLPFDRVRPDDLPLVGSSLPGLLMISFGMAILPTSCSSAPNSRLRSWSAESPRRTPTASPAARRRDCALRCSRRRPPRRRRGPRRSLGTRWRARPATGRARGARGRMWRARRAAARARTAPMRASGPAGRRASPTGVRAASVTATGRSSCSCSRSVRAWTSASRNADSRASMANWASERCNEQCGTGVACVMSAGHDQEECGAHRQPAVPDRDPQPLRRDAAAASRQAGAVSSQASPTASGSSEAGTTNSIGMNASCVGRRSRRTCRTRPCPRPRTRAPRRRPPASRRPRDPR